MQVWDAIWKDVWNEMKSLKNNVTAAIYMKVFWKISLKPKICVATSFSKTITPEPIQFRQLKTLSKKWESRLSAGHHDHLITVRTCMELYRSESMESIKRKHRHWNEMPRSSIKNLLMVYPSVSQPGFRGTLGFPKRSLRVPREKRQRPQKSAWR